MPLSVKNFISQRRLNLPLYICAVFLVLVINFITFFPVLESPYLGDDSGRESVIRGAALLADKSLIDICWGTLKDQIHSGRWYPLVIYYFPVFYYLDQGVYKFITIIFVMLNITLFGYLAGLVSFSRSASLLAMLLPPLFLQLRIYHDPILAYYFLMQIEFFLICVSLIFFILRLRSNKKIYMLISLSAYILCLLIYEPALSFAPIYIFIACFHPGNGFQKALRAVFPFLVAGALNLCVALLIRHQFGVHYDGVRIGMLSMEWLQTFSKQLFAALPLSYVFSSAWSDGFNHLNRLFTGDFLVLCLTWSVTWALIANHSLGTNTAPNQYDIKMLLVSGVALWVFPSATVAFSEKYQRELQWGLGYLPVYWSAFGVMFITLAGALLFLRGLRGARGGVKWAALAVTAALGCVVFGLNTSSNRLVIERCNIIEHYPRRILERAMQAGLMKSIPEGSYLVCDAPIHSWENPPFFRLHAGLALEVINPAGSQPDGEMGDRRVQDALKGFKKVGSKDLYNCQSIESRASDFSGYDMQFKGMGWPIVVLRKSSAKAGGKRKVFYLRFAARSGDVGYAILAKVDLLRADDNNIRNLSSREIYVYIDIPRGCQQSKIEISGTCTDRNLQNRGAFRLQGTDAKLVSADGSGMILSIPKLKSGVEIDPKSIKPRITSGTAFANSRVR
jgi:hypothetical protein